ncbi:MAG TPA: thioredoxin domain-containing protein [Usitatibacteraceae bacterium]|nr:thioredoxin domain-containing protein [Usitatibacteraceae bacterium]
MNSTARNTLSQSTSPYLLQHATNPVFWQEWGPEALALARADDRPILLSIGYSACHWCHVMAHESFEDESIAAIMNEHFVNIKVDREERPDIDQIYQTAHALLTQRSGGWPLTMFLSPDGRPFFGGTYFPKSARYGLPGFGDLLLRVARYFREQREDIDAQNQRMVEALAREAATTQAGDALPDADVIEAGFRQVAQSFDPHWGGFGSAPKFPHPERIELCLRRYASAGDAQARDIACLTLQRMCEGGIYDHLAGGFARYSVDEEWTIPHFEKMLYDNGPLLRLLADGFRASDNTAQRQLFRSCAFDTAGWALREMRSPGGGFHSSLDADADGHEGRYTVWSREQVRAVLNEDQWRIVEPHYGLDQPANFEGQSWNLRITQPLEEIAGQLRRNLSDCQADLDAAKRALFLEREKRQRPGRDDKILVSWNALMIEGLAHASRVFGQPQWLAAAREALEFIRTAMWDPERQRLYATHKDGVSHLNAYLDDYAFLLKAILEILQCDFRVADLEFAKQLAAVLQEQFEDCAHGGWFFTANDHESLIQRPKPGFDNATPSGNGVAAFALRRLGQLTGDPTYADASDRALRGFARSIEQRPSANGTLLMALDEALEPAQLLVLDGPPDEVAGWKSRLEALPLHNLIIVNISAASGPLPPPLAHARDGTVNAWLCQGVHCLPVIRDFSQLQAALKTPIISRFS